MSQFVSVIIPVYGDYAGLERCLAALSNQSLPNNQFEVLIVDNHKQPQYTQVHFVSSNVRLLHEPAPGSYAARNRALQEARGEIVAFTDSDCIPERDWLSKAVERLSRPNARPRLAGRVELFTQGSQPNLAELYDLHNGFRQEANAQKGTSVTANMITFTHVLERVGSFNAALLSGGDHEWGYRAQKAGFGIEFAPDVVVRHPARSRLRPLIRKHQRVAAGKYTARAAQVLLGHFLYTFRPPVRKYLSFRQKHPVSRVEALKLTAVQYVIDLVRSAEHLRIALGLSTRRRG